MKNKKIIGMAALLAFAATALQSCLDYDTPGDEFSTNTEQVDDTLYQGDADKLTYDKPITESGFNEAMQILETPMSQAQGGLFALRGGKDGNLPGEHSYQRQFTFGPDNFAQMCVVPHTDFMYGTYGSTYEISKDFTGGPLGCYAITRNALAPALNHPQIDSIPEMKAIYLLCYDYGSIEMVDEFGPLPYVAYKNNQVAAPFEYDAVDKIYKSVKENLDDIVACLKHFPEQPEWYRQQVLSTVADKAPLAADRYDATDLEAWWRFANSFKLRLAIHIAKVEPDLAKEWAEEAVKSGVTERTDHEMALVPMTNGFTHPLGNISYGWHDSCLAASFESLLHSLNHPYIQQAESYGEMLQWGFSKNSAAITNTGHNPQSSAPDITPADTRVIGMREGAKPGQGQTIQSNPYAAYSVPSQTFIFDSGMPCYIMKLSEVCFLRAEGVLRGWDMGGSAQQFYEDGIRYASVADRSAETGEWASFPYYQQALDEYMAQENPTPYTWVDPQGISADEPSVTKIGVKWNDGDPQEIKLEKIITQKYIASFPYSLEAWVDLRRTGYPKMFPVLNPGDGDGSLAPGDIIRRIPWTTDDVSTLEDLNETGIPALGGPNLQGTRLWWDVNKPNF